MNYIILKTTFIIMLITSTAMAAGFDDITYMTEQYPPYNYKTDGKVQGIASEVMQTIMKKLNINKPIEIRPWANSYNRVQTMPNTCLFSMTYTPERKPLFKWVGPVADSNITLVALKKNNIQINNLNEANKYKVGAIRSDIGEQLLLKGGVKRSNIDSVAETILNIKKLSAGRIDLIAYGDTPLKWEIKKAGFNSEDFQTVFRISKGELYIAFHKETPDVVIQEFQQALDELKSDGSYQAILDKYLK